MFNIQSATANNVTDILSPWLSTGPKLPKYIDSEMHVKNTATINMQTRGLRVVINTQQQAIIIYP
jgi:hypothetical protein